MTKTIDLLLGDAERHLLRAVENADPDYDVPANAAALAKVLAWHKLLNAPVGAFPPEILAKAKLPPAPDHSEVERITKLLEQARKLEATLVEVWAHGSSRSFLDYAYYDLQRLDPAPDDSTPAELYFETDRSDPAKAEYPEEIQLLVAATSKLTSACDLALYELRGNYVKKGAPKRRTDRLIKDLAPLVEQGYFPGESRRDKKLGQAVAEIIVRLVSLLEIKISRKTVENVLSNPKKS